MGHGAPQRVQTSPGVQVGHGHDTGGARAEHRWGTGEAQAAHMQDKGRAQAGHKRGIVRRVLHRSPLGTALGSPESPLGSPG